MCVCVYVSVCVCVSACVHRCTCIVNVLYQYLTYNVMYVGAVEIHIIFFIVSRCTYTCVYIKNYY